MTLVVYLFSLEKDLSCASPLCPKDAETNSDNLLFASLCYHALLSTTVSLLGLHLTH